jgi:LysM repeat protein
MDTVLVYQVRSGDSLTTIAESISASAGVTPDQITSVNKDLNPSALQVGEVINIPAVNGGDSVLMYTVLAGDTLWGICQGLQQCHGMTVQLIVEDNSGLDADVINVGQLLNIPKIDVIVDPFIVLANNMGYWDWTYSNAEPPPNTTLSLAFSGEIVVSEVLSKGQLVFDTMVGDKYICFGGGNAAGSFNLARIEAITNAINSGTLCDYDGIAYDVEMVEMDLEDAFATSFKAAQDKGLKVLVTISHSAPYDIIGASDANMIKAQALALMKSFFVNKNINIISPQLYTNGDETENDYSWINVNWNEYVNCIAQVVPSIVKASYYTDAEQYFGALDIELSGYVQWQQT